MNDIVPQSNNSNGTAEPLKSQELHDETDFDPLEIEILTDWKWVHENGHLFSDYPGEHVAVANQKIWGHSPNATELLQRVSQESGLPLQRFVLTYIEGELSIY